MLLSGIIHHCLHKLVLILPDKGNHLVQLTEYDLFQHYCSDEVNCTAVLILCISAAFQMFLVDGHGCRTAQIQFLSAIGTVTDA